MDNNHNYDDRPMFNSLMNPNFQREESAKPQRKSQAENREFRRASLLAAALKTVAQYDIQGATVERICAEAGASRGLIAHYYDSKEALLLAALKNWFETALAVKTELAQDMEQPAEQRIRQIAYSSFYAPAYSWEIAAAWQAFTNASRHNKAYALSIRNASRYVRGLLVPLFKQAAMDNEVDLNAKEAAQGLYGLEDGLWNSLATGKDDLTIQAAKAICDRYIDGCLKR